jgi:hypothetical protein
MKGIKEPCKFMFFLSFSFFFFFCVDFLPKALLLNDGNNHRRCWRGSRKKNQHLNRKFIDLSFSPPKRTFAYLKDFLLKEN